MDYSSQILENFLNLYWIRPETALWRTLDVLQMKSIKFKKPILDIGCGGGRHSIPIAKMGANVTGVDISPQMLVYARKNAKKNRCAKNTNLIIQL